MILLSLAVPDPGSLSPSQTLAPSCMKETRAGLAATFNVGRNLLCRCPERSPVI